VDRANGNVYVTGASPGSGTLDDYATIAYSSFGTALWTNRYGNLTNGIDTALALAIDAGSGNVYVTGYSQGSGTGSDYATLAYSSIGQPLWTNRYNSAGNPDDTGHAVAVDARSGNVYVTGGGGDGCVTLAYSKNGDPLWTNRIAGTGLHIAVDSNGNVIVAGRPPSSGSYTDYDYLFSSCLFKLRRTPLDQSLQCAGERGRRGLRYCSGRQRGRLCNRQLRRHPQRRHEQRLRDHQIRSRSGHALGHTSFARRDVPPERHGPHQYRLSPRSLTRPVELAAPGRVLQYSAPLDPIYRFAGAQFSAAFLPHRLVAVTDGGC
jgi:hypothetical protein